MRWRGNCGVETPVPTIPGSLLADTACLLCMATCLRNPRIVFVIAWSSFQCSTGKLLNCTAGWYSGESHPNVLQEATHSVEDSRKTIVEAQAALQQAGRLPTAEAESLRLALQDLWRSERDEFREEARQFAAEAVAHGHDTFESALPDEDVGARKPRRATGAPMCSSCPCDERDSDPNSTAHSRMGFQSDADMPAPVSVADPRKTRQRGCDDASRGSMDNVWQVGG